MFFSQNHNCWLVGSHGSHAKPHTNQNQPPKTDAAPWCQPPLVSWPLAEVDMTPGVPLASGFNQGDDPQQAMDDDASTVWTANCQSCNETRKHLGERKDDSTFLFFSLKIRFFF